ncbi:LysM peptidoglycan-binding domain-containing protein [Microbacterium trichothecenolyticum]
MLAGVPVAVAGSIALSLSAVPAHAATTDAAPLSVPRTLGVAAADVPRVTALPAVRVTAQTAPAKYTVQRGDTVSRIAARFGLRTADVLALNGLGWSSTIYPGQVLKLSAAAAAPAPAAPAPAPAAGSYTVQRGDTISAIAKRHGTTTNAVLSANGLGWSSIIYPGQTIKIPSSATSIPGLTAEQVSNAQLIVRIGRELGVSDRAIAIALGTAMQESSLRNVTWGDRDSLGLFQQRPSYGWGTAAEVQDAARATRAFFGGAGDPNGSRTRGLLDIPGWENLTFTQAAQAVQISAYPDAYARWEASAYSWLAALG